MVKERIRACGRGGGGGVVPSRVLPHELQLFDGVISREKKRKGFCFLPNHSAAFLFSPPKGLLVAGEVLTRLPAKSLMRFKCVSKLWRSTISHPSFCKAHRRARSRAAAGLIMVCILCCCRCSNIEVCWGLMLSAFCMTLDHSDDRVAISQCFQGFDMLYCCSFYCYDGYADPERCFHCAAASSPRILACGCMEFVVPPSDSAVFFPISVRFTAVSTFSGLKSDQIDLMVKERVRPCGRGRGGVVPRELPHDLVAGEVLTRLAAKSLMRFKCVSKLWRSTISHPCFCKAHRARSRLSRGAGGGGLIMVFPETDIDDDDNDLLVGVGFFYATLPSTRDPPVIDLLYQFRIGSPSTEEEEEEDVSYLKDYLGYTRFINGLFCLYTADRVSICNFSTREIMDLPAPPTRPFQQCLYYLGFDSTTNEYKLLKVCTVNCRKDEDNEEEEEEEEEGEDLYFDSKFDILTLGKDKSWRSLHDAPAIDAWKLSACFNGRLYWWDPAGRELIHFSFNNERFGFTSRPPRTPRNVGAIHQFRGDLALLVGFVDQALALWVFESGLSQIIEDNGETQDVKAYSWCLRHIQVPYAIANRNLKFLENLPTGEVLMTGMEEAADSNSNSPFPMPIYSYDHTSRKSEKFITGKNYPSSRRKYARTLQVFYYEENIMPLDHLISNK
ncbi:uncharacterized protein LOC131326863 [Rhododendron vialii]|uniref:uncharacterized protein LOC131326863 n=1 Tax=Rhododendron vialii TaxID=182163 RepID=UPI00265EA9E2|nr:uncharacterized protein LOC131326863 [Rhododendron vialii]